MPQPQPTVGSLFSGIGGLDLGLERAGWSVKWQVENNEWCNRVLAKHWPDTPRREDIHDVGAHNLEKVDLIAGGFPCQPFSHAGRRSAEGDDRYLWPEMLRVIRELRPRFVLAENVYGLVTIQQGLVLETVYLDLEDAGYEVAPPIVFPAAAVGALHRRDRVWIAARCHDSGWPAADSNNGHFAPQEELRSGRAAARQGRREAVANSDKPGLERRDGRVVQERPGQCAAGKGGASLADAPCNPRGLRYGDRQTDGRFWNVEPPVGRVANGIPVELDFIRGVEDASRNDSQAIPETQVLVWGILRYVWECQAIAASSPDVYRRGLLNLVPELPYRDSSGGWYVGKRIEAYKGLRDLWEAFYAAPQQEAQDLQRQLLERIGKAQCPKEVGSRTDRLRGLGNAVVPQAAEVMGRALLELMR